MQTESIKKLAILPAYNEEENIVGLYRELLQSAGDYDVIVVNDGSRDTTLRLCREQGIPVLDLAVNLGIGGAMQTGYRYALRKGYDIAVQVDGDGQHDPAFLNQMTEKLLAENADMVIGSRFLERDGYQSTALRRFGIRFFSFLIRRLTGSRISDPTSGFRMIRGELIRDFAESYPYDYPEPESIVRLLKHGYRIVELPVRMRGRNGGRSSIRPAYSLYYMVKVTAAIVLERMRAT